jgi:dimethylhistidine N-methyltransferase
LNGIVHGSSNYKKYVVDSRLQYFKPHSTKIEKSFAEEISYSLNRNSKFINPKFFYDQKGSELFEQICLLDEYYLTRTEISILETLKNKLSLFLDNSFRLVELGSGASVKTRLILDVFNEIHDCIEYFPIDISEILTESSEVLLRDYPNLTITGIIDTYEGGLEFIENFDDKQNLIVFLGSSFGNFSPTEGKTFLKKIHSTMKDSDLFLVGLDLVKNKLILEKAYDDSKRITAKFNLNVLSRINDELDADFNLDNFEHYVVYNEQQQRVEMYLKSLVSQSVIISKSNLSLQLQKGELINTEYSYKYKLDQIEELMIKAGFHIKAMWLDDDNLFALTLVSKNNF